ncbi:MAG: AraC family transcriptional regulator [Gemmatimonadota bacterium]|nr:AraC family transcriptional regulator [Gemmatimonadota bacterium]
MSLSKPADSSPWREVRLPGDLGVVSGSVPGGTRFRKHGHGGIHVCCVVRGGFVESTPYGPRDAGVGTVRLSPGARHDIDFGSDGAACVLLHVGSDVSREIGLRPRSTTFVEDPELTRAVARLGAAARRTDVTAELDLEGEALEILAQLARQNGPGGTPEWLRRAREAIHDARGEPVTLASLADEVGVHRCHLARRFRKRYGVPVGAYWRRVRLRRCLRLLAGSAPLARVAARAGFADQSHMTRELAARFGTTPARFRAQR